MGKSLTKIFVKPFVMCNLAAALVSGFGTLSASPVLAQNYTPRYAQGYAQNYAQNHAMRPVRENHRTYLINGLASAMPFIGYGFNNLKKKLANARHYTYLTPIEGRVVVQSAVYADIKRQYRRDPSIKINLVGISYGGNIVTSLASRLHKDGIPINYLSVLDGPVLAKIPPNVHRVDNFVCRIAGCIGQRIRLTPGNRTTLVQEFIYRTSHVGLSDYAKVHRRIEGQLTAFPLYVATRPGRTMPGIDYSATASIPQR